MKIKAAIIAMKRGATATTLCEAVEAAAHAGHGHNARGSMTRISKANRVAAAAEAAAAVAQCRATPHTRGSGKEVKMTAKKGTKKAKAKEIEISLPTWEEIVMSEAPESGLKKLSEKFSLLPKDGSCEWDDMYIRTEEDDTENDRLFRLEKDGFYPVNIKCDSPRKEKIGVIAYLIGNYKKGVTYALLSKYTLRVYRYGPELGLYVRRIAAEACPALFRRENTGGSEEVNDE